MHPHEIILVCGFGRCGSSLVMQMLEAAGVPVTGEWPGFEDPRALTLPAESNWLFDDCRGKAVKVLDPHRHTPPLMRTYPSPILDYHYRTIWLDRNRTEQAKSQMKMLRMLGQVRLTAREVRAGVNQMAESYRRDRPLCMRILHDLGPVLSLRFEEVLLHPHLTANQIVRFLELDAEPQALGKAVRGSRGTGCSPDLAMELSLLREREEVTG